MHCSLSKGPSQLVGKSETKVVKIFKEREREREREKIIIYISVMVDKGSISELRLFIDKFWGQIVKGWCKKILSGFIYVFAKKLFCWGWW